MPASRRTRTCISANAWRCTQVAAGTRSGTSEKAAADAHKKASNNWIWRAVRMGMGVQALSRVAAVAGSFSCIKAST